MLPIPGTSSVGHLEENVAAATVRLSDAEFESLAALGSASRGKVRGAIDKLARRRS